MVFLCALAATTLVVGCEEETTAPLGVPTVRMDTDAGGNGDAMVEPPNLVSALDDAEYTELCEGAQERRDAAKPSAPDRIQIGCVAMVAGAEMPASVGECETKVAACVDQQGGVAPAGLSDVFDMMCEIRKQFDEDVTVEEVLDCGAQIDAKIKDLKDTVTCEAVVADPSAGMYQGPEDCDALVDGKTND
ncbi:MAG: hypothetical protein KC416_01240 [Myxococcales bacterium]|nr:hypothetical protein [Myxococcales bacterium]